MPPYRYVFFVLLKGVFTMSIKDKKTRLVVYIPDWLMGIIDSRRGNESRSTFASKVLKNWFSDELKEDMKGGEK